MKSALCITGNCSSQEFNTPGMGLAQNWLAWEEGKTIDQMQRVVWVHQLGDGRIVDAWVNTNDLSQKWNSQTRKWNTI